MSRLSTLQEVDAASLASPSPSPEALLAQKQVARLRHNVENIRKDASAKRDADTKFGERKRGLYSIFSGVLCWSNALRLPWSAEHSKESAEISDDPQQETSQDLPVGFRARGDGGRSTYGALADLLRPTLSTLFPELIVEILGYLSPREISSAQRICQYLHNVVTGSPVLQYTIERHLASVDESSFIASLPSHKERRRHLERWRDASRSQSKSLRKVDERREPSNSIEWGAHGSVIWRHDRWGKTVDFTILPSSTSTAIGRKQWRIAYPRAFFVNDVYYDSTDDLLVLQVIVFDEGMRTVDMFLVFKEGTTGRAHPDAPAPFWRIPTPGLPITKSRVELRQGLIAVSYVICKDLDSGNRQRNFVILDWKNIHSTVFTMCGPHTDGNPTPDDVPLKTMAFVSPELLACFMYTSKDRLELAVFPWKDLPLGSRTIEDVLPFATMFQLPQAAEGWSYEFPKDSMYQGAHSEITWDPQPKKQAHTESVFVPSEQERSRTLVRLLYNMEERADRLTWHHIECAVYVPEAVLVSHVASRRADQAPRVVPWDEWGASSRITRTSYTNRHVYGNKRVTIRATKAEGETVKFVVDQFDSLDSMLKYVDEDIIAESSKIHFSNPRRARPFHESALEKSTLPYRSVSYDTGIACSDWYIRIIAVGDNCVILRQRCEEDDCIHVFSL